MAVDFDELLAGPVEEAFGESVTITRTSGGTFDPALGRRTGGSTLTATITADVQKTFMRSRGMAGGSVDEQEFVVNVRASTIAATTLGTPQGGDVLRVNTAGITSRIVSVEPEAGRTMFRCLCRTEKRS